jgi:hypothetical protein
LDARPALPDDDPRWVRRVVYTRKSVKRPAGPAEFLQKAQARAELTKLTDDWVADARVTHVPSVIR